jgi:hypothetical protein
MYEDLYELETENALAFRAANPRPPEPPKASAWAQAGELLKAIPKGVGQAAMQTARNVQSGPVAGNPFVMSASEQEEMLAGSGVTSKAIDQDLRRGIDALKPDPVASTVASQILQDGARVLSKVALYATVGRGAGAIAGTGLDEGLTGRTEMMDQGVDKSTATKVGAVRGLAMAAGVAVPVVGATGLRTAAIIAAGGPGLFMTEQVTTRAILEAAEYPDLARQYDPLDPVGLGVSLLVPGVVGAVVHRSRAKAKGAQTAPDAPTTENAPPVAETGPGLTELLRDMPDVRDAALVAHKSQVLDSAMLADKTNLAARQSHIAAFEKAAQAMDEGMPVRIDALDLDPVKAKAAMNDLHTLVQANEADAAALRRLDDMDDLPEVVDPTARRRGVDDGEDLAAPELAVLANESLATARTAQPAAMLDSQDPAVRRALQPLADLAAPREQGAPAAEATPLQRAQRIAEARPEMAIEFDGEQTTAARLVEQATEDSARNKRDAGAFRAAVECLLRG